MYVADPCTRYGMSNGCDDDCPVLNDGDCSIEAELAEETDWYQEWAISIGREIYLKVEQTNPVEDDYDRAMELLNLR